MIITSLNNEKIKYLTKLNQKKYRNDTFLVEGKHLVEEAYKKNLVKLLIVLEDYKLDNVDTIKVSYDVMKKISLTDTPPKIMAEVIKKEDKKIGNRVIILDNITDPGNLGTIIRSAVAFNFDTVILSNNTTDLYNPKVIRATEGMLFNINIIRDNLLNIIPKLKEEKYFILGTKVTNGKDITKYHSINKIALIMGNETRGMNNDLDNLCDDYIYIKMNNKCESLNVGVSASILMYELNK
ncbi:MAG: TrmH family RNA methyltransferase [Bacilli bacterium]